MFAQQIDRGKGGIKREWAKIWPSNGMLGKEVEELKNELVNIT
jgi:hypothetical protein